MGILLIDDRIVHADDVLSSTANPYTPGSRMRLASIAVR